MTIGPIRKLSLAGLPAAEYGAELNGVLTSESMERAATQFLPPGSHPGKSHPLVAAWRRALQSSHPLLRSPAVRLRCCRDTDLHVSDVSCRARISGFSGTLALFAASSICGLPAACAWPTCFCNAVIAWSRFWTSAATA